MNKKFIPAKEAYRKLKFASSFNTAVYVYGATGYGKTKLVQEYLDENKTLWLSPIDAKLDLSEIEQQVNEGGISNIVIDDLQQIHSEECYHKILEFSRENNIWLILIGRCPTPQNLIPLISDGKLIVISEKNLVLSEEEVIKIAEINKLKITEDNIKCIVHYSQGNAFMISTTIQLLKSGEVYDSSLKEKIYKTFINHLEANVIPQWSVNLQEFLMKISVVDSFTLPMAVMITGDDRAALMLEESLKVGNFLFRDGEVYTMRQSLLQALRNRALKVLGHSKCESYINNAGLYFETQDMVLDALKMYEKSGNKDRIRSLLIRNGRRHFGDGHFYELRQYYLSLDDKETDNSPVLMSAMSMLYSVMMNSEQSEYWYDKLKSYATRVKGGEKREVDEMLVYLDIALPHRGTIDMIDIIKRTVSLAKYGGVKLQEFSVTNNQPSAMNGGKDFCNWSKKDQFLADTIGKMVEKLLGKFGRGIVHAALCESFYEKGGRDAAVVNHAMLAQMEIEGGGKLELLFVAVGIQVRLSMLVGNVYNAMQILDAFEKRAVSEKKYAILLNIKALRCQISLMSGDKNFAEEWLKESPDELAVFWALERYRYIIKVLCYLEFGKNTEAINLLTKLRYYADVNKRTYIRMECGILMAIALYREKQEWKQILTDSLNEISEYKFVRIISEKGAGIFPLLKSVKREYINEKKTDSEWFLRVYKETEQVADRYPAYLNSGMAQPSDFKEDAMTVLRMQADGYSVKEIAVKMNLSERTVKYYASENYKKLGAKGKTDAVQKARSMNLI